MTMLGDAYYVAALAHRYDTCKAGVTYILHPIKVAHDGRHEDEDTQCARVLHDVKEDHPDVWEEHKHLFTEKVHYLVDALTRREDETYGQFIMRISRCGREAIDIKLDDIKHNSDLRRMPLHRDITEKDLARANKYRIATIFLNRVKRGESPESIEHIN